MKASCLADCFFKYPDDDGDGIPQYDTRRNGFDDTSVFPEVSYYGTPTLFLTLHFCTRPWRPGKDSWKGPDVHYARSKELIDKRSKPSGTAKDLFRSSTAPMKCCNRCRCFTTSRSISASAAAPIIEKLTADLR
jgi:hypothetical protein